MDPLEFRRVMARRDFLRHAGAGIGTVALADLLHGAEPVNPLAAESSV